MTKGNEEVAVVPVTGKIIQNSVISSYLFLTFSIEFDSGNLLFCMYVWWKHGTAILFESLQTIQEIEMHKKLIADIDKIPKFVELFSALD